MGSGLHVAIPSLPGTLDTMGRGGRLGKERLGASLERRAVSRNRRGGVLIACNRQVGLYLAGLLDFLQLEEEVTLSLCATEDSHLIVENGLRACATGGPFQRFYAVICCDNREEVLHHAMTPPDLCTVGFDVAFRWITTVPSFNLWLLLHWQDLPLDPWTDYDHLSRCINEQLHRHLPPTAAHDALSLFAAMGPGLTEAIRRGQRLSRIQAMLNRGQTGNTIPPGTILPTTDVHELVSYLLKLHEKSQRLRN
ncbi:MAG: hypothetical protein HQL87_09125 [Magnetococcales bacterium]|nr:hypothetical protein [Magnetococcales bacterium]